MNFDVRARTILRVVHGSYAYGTNVPTSDRDVKGVCIEPMSHRLGFLHSFEQFERAASKGHDTDEVIYALWKFAKLASDCNPNIIEVLHVDDSDVFEMDDFGAELRHHRYAFLSRKAKFTFSGYAHAQLKRIKTHRAWLLNPPVAPPTRKEFGLSEATKLTTSELGAFEASVAQGMDIELPKDVLTLFVKEKQYASAKMHFDQYVNWTKTRNPARSALEAKYGYDTKHGMHLLRLMRMCVEILKTGHVYVRRPDAAELLTVRNGGWEYDRLIEEAERLQALCDELYETSMLQHEPDRAFLDNLIVDMTLRYYKKHDG